MTLVTYGAGDALGNLRIKPVTPAKRPRWRSIASDLPGSAWELASPEATATVKAKLADGPWHAVIVDHAAMGWSLPLVKGAGVPLVYVSHNHEASVRPAVARASKPRWKQPLLRWDAAKFARLEKALAAEAVLVTAITEDDAALFQQLGPGGPVLALTPSYDAAMAQPPALTGETPRRVMLLGRYDWVAKQENLARWAAEGVPVLAAADVETMVIGHVPAALQARLARPGLRFAGEQADLTDSLPRGRIGLVAEGLGGFKMKTLDYIFHGLPMAALPGGFAGLPEGVVQNALEAPTPKVLAEAILAVIDNLPRLVQMQHGALAAAQAAFDWQSRGEVLVSTIEEACLRSSARSR